MSNSSRRLFSTLVEPHFDALYRTAMRLTRNPVDAEDLVQEACLRAYAQLESLERADQPAAWLQRVQYRIFVDGVRHRRRAPFAALHDAAELLALTASDAPNPEEAADGGLLEQHLEHAWRLLGSDQRALLALHAEGYTLSDLELITGASRNAIGVRLHRARARLAKLLQARLDGKARELGRRQAGMSKTGSAREGNPQDGSVQDGNVQDGNVQDGNVQDGDVQCANMEMHR